MLKLTIIVFILLLLAVGCLVGYLILKRKQTRGCKGGEFSTEEETIRAIGLRGLVNASTTSDEAKKRLLSIQPSGSFGVSKSRERQITQEYSQMSSEAVDKTLASIKQMVVDLKVRFKHFEGISPEILNSTSKDIVSNLILARNFLIALEKRVELVNNQLDLQIPNPKKAYEIATERLVLSYDSVNALTSDQKVEPIRWTSLGSVVREVLQKLDVSISECRRIKQSNKTRYTQQK